MSTIATSGFENPIRRRRSSAFETWPTTSKSASVEDPRHALAQEHGVVGEHDPDRGARSAAGRVQRREHGIEPCDVELVQVLGPVEILEVRIAELARARSLGQVALEQGVRRVREEHLAAVAGIADPGRPVHVEADIAILGDHGLAGVDPHANADIRRLGPVVPRDAPLGVGRRGDRLARPSEDPERRVALRVDLLAVVASEGGAKDLLMVRHHPRVPVAELVDEPGRPLDVGEEEGDGTGGELPCH